jgi:hypothetical protein
MSLHCRYYNWHLLIVVMLLLAFAILFVIFILISLLTLFLKNEYFQATYSWTIIFKWRQTSPRTIYDSSK